MTLSTLANCAIGPVALLILALPGLATPARKLVVVIVLLGCLDVAATMLPIIYKPLQFPGVHWNWAGKLFDLAAMSAVAIVLMATKTFSAPDLGLTLRQAPGTGRAVLFVMLPWLVFVAAITATMFGEATPSSHETLLYEATMPGLAEELFWRGILLALFDRLYTGRFTLWGAEIGYGVFATTFLFGLVHALAFDDHMAIQFAPLGGLMAAVSGFLLAWLRTRSKSLVLPVIMHNATNLILESVPRLL
ncbi:MAG TPA: CPBP family intramembrane glutamic endopeptidase [Rhizomicrobium sp.]|jgi:hypothetical protein